MWTSAQMSVFLSGCLTLLMLEEPPLHSISLESFPGNNGFQESVYLTSVGVTLMCWSGLLAVPFRALNHTASTAVIGVQKASAKKATLSTEVYHSYSWRGWALGWDVEARWGLIKTTV